MKINVDLYRLDGVQKDPNKEPVLIKHQELIDKKWVTTAMNVEIKIALEHLDKMSRIIEHEGKKIPKKELKKILVMAQNQGLKTIYDIPSSLIDSVLKS